jgi:hypothetical protein
MIQPDLAPAPPAFPPFNSGWEQGKHQASISIAAREAYARWVPSTATADSRQETATHATWLVFLIGVRGAMAFDYPNGTWTVAPGNLQ